MITGTTVYNFTYSPDGLLNSIIDVNGNRLSLIRNSNEVCSLLEKLEVNNKLPRGERVNSWINVYVIPLQVPNKIVLPNRIILELQFNSDGTLQKIVEGGNFFYIFLSEGIWY